MDTDLAGGAGIISTISVGLGAAVLWGSSIILKRFGISLPGTAASANEQAQKDMLDWQRDQLATEVARRERAESLNQELLKQLNDMTAQMDRLEIQAEQMKAQIETLTKTVEQFKAQMTGEKK